MLTISNGGQRANDFNDVSLITDVYCVTLISFSSIGTFVTLPK